MEWIGSVFGVVLGTITTALTQAIQLVGGGVGQFGAGLYQIGHNVSQSFSSGSKTMSMGYGAAQKPATSTTAKPSFIESLPKTVESFRPLIDVAGQVYDMYSSYESAKAARKAAENYGAQLALLGHGSTTQPMFVQQPSGGTTISFQQPQATPTSATAGSMNQQQLLLIGGVILVAFLFMSKK